MSNNKMLIDATHPEETRVVVLRGGRVEEFDYESAARKLLRGNIYLAKVTRVEPSLQAAFVDYGGNRHGFLAFNEIHPDYYQIPIADRQALLEEEAAAEAAEQAEAEAAADARAERMATAPAASEDRAFEDTEAAPSDPDASTSADGTPAFDAKLRSSPESMVAEAAIGSAPLASYDRDDAAGDEASASDAASAAGDPGEQSGVEEVETVEAGNGTESEQVDSVGSEDALEELAARPRRRMRSYKIQEVIKRRQVVLIQVVKEERGTKGAALTTYLSLAGRYTVLMPNTARGGGISRKITSAQDRKRLKAVAQELEVPEGMGLIIRTAGAVRTKQEIKRDFEYLLRLWESVRDLTLQSVAPSLVYEEGNLIKRSIRDLYTKDVEEIVVAGAGAHKEAREFMRMLMPSHAKNVISYEDAEPLFTRYQIERQLNAMFSPYVNLRSGGYLVMNQTEALVAIDVNSGKSTREFSIEETALNTNQEAAEEIARQLKLRDLAGLIVIDFIDMEEKRNNRAVERRLKDALRFDRARIQVGRISHFGLLEMSRQRLRSGVLEGSTSQCPHCQGTGIIRSTESVALAVIRAIEDALMGDQPVSLVATTTAAVALYILNTKRGFINDLEARFGVAIAIQASDKLQGANFSVERSATARQQSPQRSERAAVSMDSGFEGEAEGEAEPRADEPVEETDSGDDNGRRPRRRRRRRGRDDRPASFDSRRDRAPAADEERSAEFEPRDSDGPSQPRRNGHPTDTEQPDVAFDAGERGRERAAEDEGEGGRRPRRGRRRGRRGGRRFEREARTTAEGEDRNGRLRGAPDDGDAGRGAEPGTQPARDEPPAPEPGPGVPQDSRSAVGEAPAAAAEPDGAARTTRRRSEPVASEPVLERVVVGRDVPGDAESAQPQARKGWWQRRFGSE